MDPGAVPLESTWKMWMVPCCKDWVSHRVMGKQKRQVKITGAQRLRWGLGACTTAFAENRCFCRLVPEANSTENCATTWQSPT